MYVFDSGGVGREWVRGLGLGFTNPGGTREKSDMCLCFGCGGVGGVRGSGCSAWARMGGVVVKSVFAGGGLLTLIRDNITFTTTDIPSTTNTHNTELQMVKVHINNTKHITITNMYIPPRDSTSTYYKTTETDTQHCIQYTTNIPHSILPGNVNAQSTLWHSYTDDHKGQLIAMLSATPTTNTSQSAKHHITTNSITRYHHGVNNLYNRT